MDTKSIALFLLLAAPLGLRAVPVDTYQQISERNVFRLNPPAPPAPKVDESAVPLSKVKFSGLTVVENKRKAWLVVEGKTPDQTAYLSLEEGQKENGIEVLTIDEEKGEVKISNSGKESVLNFKDNGLKASALPPIAPMVPGQPHPGQMNGAPGSMPAPGIQPFINQASPNNGQDSLLTIPSRTLRTGLAPTLQPQTQIPQGAILQPNTSEVSHTHEESIINMEIQRELNKSRIANGDVPPLPPTILSQPGGNEGGNNALNFPAFPEPIPTRTRR